MRIDIILPYKEIFSEEKASAVSLTVKNSMEYSEFKNSIKVYGQFTFSPFFKNNFVGIKTNWLMHFGHNKSILKNYVKLLYKQTNIKRLIEIHNRPYLFNIAVNKINNYPISLHYHNDPITMRGSKTIVERKRIAEKAAAVYFVSEFIKKKFLEGINDEYNNLFVLPNAIQRKLNYMPIKNKEIVFVGRLVPEKGAHLFVKSIKLIVKNNPLWKFKIIGTAKAGQKNLITNYEKKVVNEFLKLGQNTDYYGFINNTKVQKILKNASILVVPSLWDDPFPLIALEGLSNGVAVIASNRGGLNEMLKNSGILIDEIDENKLTRAINNLIINEEKLKYYQNKSWNNYNYNQDLIVKNQDNLRMNIFNHYY